MSEAETAIDYYDLDGNELWVRGRKLLELASAHVYPSLAALAICGFVPERLGSIYVAARAAAQQILEGALLPREAQAEDAAGLIASVARDVLCVTGACENEFPHLFDDDIWHALVLQQAVTGLVARRLRGGDRAEIPLDTRELLALYSAEPPHIDEAAPDPLMACLIGGFGVVAPTTALARFSASTRAPMAWAVAASATGCGPAHLGACSLAMERLVGALRESRSGMLKSYCARRPFPGFGHPIMPIDPRTNYLFGHYAGRAEVDAARGLAESMLAEHRLHPNTDFAAAAILLSFGVPPARGSLFFWLSRLPVILAHICAKRREPSFGLRATDAREKYRNMSKSWL